MGKHGVGNGQGDTESQEVAGTRQAVEDGQRGSGGRGDDSRGHGPPEEISGSAAAAAGTVGYGSDNGRRNSGRGARRRRCQPV